jgi:hypothetical protein
MLRLVVFTLILSTFATYVFADACPSEEARRAELQSDNLRTWHALYKSFESYRECDDGAIAEGYSESVARILVDHWKRLPELADLSFKDPDFGHFVLRHVDATLDIGDLDKIRHKASTQCPVALRKLCGDLRKQANLARKELH